DSSMQRVRESDILKQITDYLSAERVWWMRINTGAMFGSHKGKRWAVRFAKKGTADILCTIQHSYGHVVILWIECKRPGEKQSEEQKAFEREVKEVGHYYRVAHSFEDVVSAAKLYKGA